MRQIATIAAVAFLICCGLRPANADQRPNIVFIMTDDQASWAVGAYDGPTNAVTPNLDNLFRQGVTFTNSFVTTPVCSPSRASLATSRYGSEVGVTDWIHHTTETHLGLDPDTVTWYEQLQAAGYETGLVGKWHLGVGDQYHPTKTGFDYFMGHRGGGWSPDNPTLEKDGAQTEFKGLTTDILTDHAIDYLQERSTDQPFLLVLHYRAPHARWLPVAPEDWEPFENMDPVLPHPDYPGLKTERAKRMMREYLASVRGVDRNVGRVLSALDQLEMTDNTVVVFTSDHGYNMGHNGIHHKGNGFWLLEKSMLPAATANVPAGQRPNLYDTSLKVPTAIRWPGVARPGHKATASVTNLDWMPTMLKIAGIDSTADIDARGRDFTPLLNETPADWDNDVFTQYSTKHRTQTHMRSYRTPQWKLIRDFMNPSRDELYHLTTDPDETTNLINHHSHREIVTDLDARLRSRMIAIGDNVFDTVVAK